MAITEPTIKILWAASAGRCAFCWERLSFHGSKHPAPFTIGEMAHIRGDKPGANRHDVTQSPRERDAYSNLILLCPTHHSLIDKRENESVYTVEYLLSIKSEHEARVLARLDHSMEETKFGVATAILPLLNENRQSWIHFGPASEMARKQPQNVELHAIWLSERLSVIVPNNRKIYSLLNEQMDLFSAIEQEIIGSFMIHVRTYESWVEDSIPYAAVRRFPSEFDDLIRGLSNACEK